MAGGNQVHQNTGTRIRVPDPPLIKPNISYHARVIEDAPPATLDEDGYIDLDNTDLDDIVALEAASAVPGNTRHNVDQTEVTSHPVHNFLAAGGKSFTGIAPDTQWRAVHGPHSSATSPSQPRKYTTMLPPHSKGNTSRPSSNSRVNDVPLQLKNKKPPYANLCVIHQT